MSTESYRGFVTPIPVLRDGIWYISDPEVGWFQSATRRYAEMFWKSKVDYLIVSSYREQGLFLRTDEGDVCQRCGVLAASPVIHVDWHEELEKSSTSSKIRT